MLHVAVVVFEVLFLVMAWLNVVLIARLESGSFIMTPTQASFPFYPWVYFPWW